MQWHPAGTEWSNYYEDTNYSPEAMNHKKCLVEAYLGESNPRTVWDLGANTGVFSRIATAKDIDTISFDVDPAAVEKNYRQMRENKETKILPLCLDLTNPSPSLGWANEERLSLIERGPADTVLALALIHHLAISNNMPFSHIAAFLSQICRFLIIEFVPKNDSQVQRLLCTRDDIFPDYNQDHFESSFGDYFSILQYEKIADTERTLYLMRSRSTSN
jgi:ribosomal protein L11 methylase PrmA